MGQRLAACLGHISDLQRFVRDLKDLKARLESVSDLEHQNDVLMGQVQDLQLRVLADMTIGGPSAPPSVYCLLP